MLLTNVTRCFMNYTKHLERKFGRMVLILVFVHLSTHIHTYAEKFKANSMINTNNKLQKKSTTSLRDCYLLCFFVVKS